MPTASDTPARPKPETAVGKTPAVPIRSLHDKALKSLARRMTGYTQGFCLSCARYRHG